MIENLQQTVKNCNSEFLGIETPQAKILGK